MSSQTPSGGPSAKRRRLDAANATLRKPFRSPLISRQQKQSGTDPGIQSSPSINRANIATSGTPATPAPARRAATAPSPLVSPSPRLPFTASKSREERPTTGFTSKLASASTPSSSHGPKSSLITDNQPSPSDDDSLLQQMHASQKSLNAQLRQTQQQLELVRQARQIELASLRRQKRSDGGDGENEEVEVDEELRELVGKWRAASRVAADELFGLIRRRVEGMGGGKAWRETRRRGFYDDGFGEEKPDGGGEGGEDDEDDKEQKESYNMEGEQGAEEEEGGEENGFTMLMMLKSLNIEPDVLGYDPVEDKWRD